MGVANYDVVIVGAGAAGLSAAIGLAKHDFSVLVLEAGAFPGAENWSGCVYFSESLADPELLGTDGVEALAWERRLVERGIFSGNGHSFAGATYRDPAAFRHCYTVLRPIFDHHLSQVARQCGASILCDTTAEGLIRERGRVIGVSTSRGPVYADLVFLAEGDASHLVTKEGYEQAAPGRQDAHFLQGVKQVIEMPPGAIEEIFGVAPDEGVAYEMLLRNGRFRGRDAQLNMGGFMYTNRDSISLGFVLPLQHLRDGFEGEPNLLMEWLRGLPQIRRWTRGGHPGTFGAKLIRGGGLRDVPRLVDHGLAIGGAASAIGVDFPYPNFTGPATGMGLMLARAAVAIRREGGSFTQEELQRNYLQPLESSHWYNDVRHLRRWPGYVEKTRVFFAQSIDVLQGSLYTWTRSDLSTIAKWREWTRLIRRALPPGSWGELLADTRQMSHALGLNDSAVSRPIWRILLDSMTNSMRDLFGRARPHLGSGGRLAWHFSVLGGKEPVGPLPSAVTNWGRRLEPVLGSAAREIYRNEPVPLGNKLRTVMAQLVEQINLLDVLAMCGIAVLFGMTVALQWIVDRIRGIFGRPVRDALVDRWQAAARLACDYGRSSDLGGQGSDSDRWDEKLGRLSYESTKQSHIRLLWPTDLTRRGAIANSGFWHVCPAKVYECHTDAQAQLRLVVNYENCIKCESCWRSSGELDWGRNGGQQFIYRLRSRVTPRLLEAQDKAMALRGRPPKSRDWWSTAINRIAQRAASSGTNGHFASHLGQLENLCSMIEAKLHEFEQAIQAEPRTIDHGRAHWIETLATYAKQLTEALEATLRDGPLAQAKEPGLRDVQSALSEAANSLRAKMSDLTRRAYDRQFAWGIADARQIVGHQMEGLRRIVRLLRGHFAPAPSDPPAATRWLHAERAHDAVSAQRSEIAGMLDEAFERLDWRAIDTGTPLNDAQRNVLHSICSGVKAVGLAPGNDRKLALTELGRRIPSLAYAVASHWWSRDILRLFGGAAFEDLVNQLSSAETLAAFAWEGTVEVDRDDEGSRLRGQKIFVPTALAEVFVLHCDDHLVVLPRTTRGLRIEPLGTIGMRGSSPASLVLDNVDLPTMHRRIDKNQLERLWAVQTAADLAAIACGMAERLQQRAIEHATSRVQFPGLFLDDEFRESIGKFGAVKNMLAQIGACRYVVETMLYQFAVGDLSDESCRRALELKVVAAETMNGHPGSIPYNTTQIFGGTGYSEEDFLPMFYRDATTLLTLGVPNDQATLMLGQALLRRSSELSARPETSQTHPPVLVGLPESALFQETSQRKALQRELDVLRRVKHEIESVTARWRAAAPSDPQSQNIADVVADGLGRRQAEFAACESVLLRTHARLETGRPAELEVELLRTWLQDFVDAAHAWVDWLSDPESHITLPSIQPGPVRSSIVTSYQAILDRPAPYQTGDYLVQPFDSAAPRYVPELVPFDPELGRYDRELDEFLRLNYRDKLFGGRSYERHVEAQHRLNPEDFDLFRDHGFLKMYVPTEFGGLGMSKAKYNLLVKNLIRNGDVGQTLTVQANSSIGTVPILLGFFKELPRARKELAGFRGQTRERDEIATALDQLSKPELSRSVEQLAERFRRLEKQVQTVIGRSAVLRVLYHQFLLAMSSAAAALRSYDLRSMLTHLGSARAAFAAGSGQIDEFAGELDRRAEALPHFFRWIASGQMTAFALTEPSAGSDTARVATRAVLRSVEAFPEPDGSFRFVPAAGGGERRVIDSRRLEFRPDGVFYRWSDGHEPARIMFDEYDYDAVDSDRPRYYKAGPVKVPFHDIAQIRPRVATSGGSAAGRDRSATQRFSYDYWELNGAKMWLTNARMCGVMVLYAKTNFGVTSFYVDRHAEGLLVGKNEEKMGQKASVTNELGLQAVRVARENVNGLEGRGQVNALEALNAGRSGLTTSSTTSMEDLHVRAERFALDRHGKLTPLVRHRLEEIAEIRFMCESIACELVERADHRDTQTFRIEPSIGKMMSSELLMRVIQLCEDIYGLEGHTALHNLEKHKRDHRIITVYEGTNDIQRTVILKDLVREILPRYAAKPSSPAQTTGSDKLHLQRGTLEEIKRELHRVLSETVAIFGDEITSNPNMQSVFFGLSDAAALVKLADASLVRAEWIMRHLDPVQDASYRDWTVRVVRRVVARLRHQFMQRLAHVTESVTALRQGGYPPQIRAGNLMMAVSETAPIAPAPRTHEVNRAIQIVVVLEIEPTVSPASAVSDGRWEESHYRLEPTDAAALAAARSVAASATAPARVVVVAAGPRRAAKVLEESLACGADEAVHVLTDDRSLAPESLGRALARAIESTCRAPDLIVTRASTPGSTAGLAGMLAARELALQFVPNAQSFAIRFTEDEASAIVTTTSPSRPVRLSLPAAIGIAGTAAPTMRIVDYLAAFDRPMKLIAWPEDITRRFIRLFPSAAAPDRSSDTLSTSRMTAGSAAQVLLDRLGIGADSDEPWSQAPLRGRIDTVEKLTVTPGGVLVIVATDANGRIRPADRRTLRVASALARNNHRSLTALIFALDNQDAMNRAAGDAASFGAGVIVLAVTEQFPDPRRANELWSRILVDKWSPDWSGFGVIVASVWAESAVCRFGSRQAELVCRVNEIAAGPNTVIARSSRVEGRVDAVRELPEHDTKPTWITVTETAETELQPLDEIAESEWQRWPVAIGQLPSRRELMDLLTQVREAADMARLNDAEFIIDVGFGIGNSDGYDEVIVPLVKQLRELGVPQVTIGASRKVTEELRVVPPSQQIGQTGQSVNPLILLAIGISGAPQHLNYIGQRATILAFNRDPEAPIMTLNQRQPKPRVFPVVGDLFQTIPAFSAALREHVHSPNRQDHAVATTDAGIAG